MPKPFSHPILSCSASHEWEQELLKSEEDAWQAMLRVGVKLGRGIRDFYAMSSFPQSGLRVLALVGKGHNGGDALLALAALALEEGYLRQVDIVLSSELDALKPNTKRALGLLQERASIVFLQASDLRGTGEVFDICIDGLLGMQFRPPLRERITDLIETVNEVSKIRLRVAVDLPSGVGDESDERAFRADVTFATGIFKQPLLGCRNAGVIRYLDIGFFENDRTAVNRVVTDQILDPLRGVRSAFSEKRQHGHLAILAGSRGMPGALAMAVRAALQSGVGLVTVFAPESVVSQLACTLPEAMWRTWPETPEGGLALEGLWQIKSIAGKATALLVGPGMGNEAETQALLCEVGRYWNKPAVLDADALRPEVVDSFLASELILTPHDGEFKRLASVDEVSDADVLGYAKERGLTLVKKGSSTRVCDGEALYVNPTGNAVLSRGGSGDLLAGLMAGLLAEGSGSSTEVACRAVYWHGKAADLLAVSKGQVATRTTDLLDYLVPALRGDAG
ncbi:NAD(P)H-hydrate dehydratase [Pelagicoccus mobilis]|uniref:ADP-dependent (S)-NAD(P)H-hydrate dehydratase n=1 Tax=Pelagicoccus mobilis TaxID=415221 RepID=A0A934RUI4_9BACT|nr:NAD(P)H-hydrate dehydratase [Pelagicoccus mobilis]MBK1877885.1 NAD(P)H-hydrate dehydratase [Pelagicoccus mobilis]